MSTTHSKRSAVESPDESPPLTRTQQDMSQFFEFVADDLDDAAHRRMDEELIQYCSSPSTLNAAASLLSIIVALSNGRLESKYLNPREAHALLEAHPALLELLREAWDSKTFRAIRNLSKLSLLLFINDDF